MKEFKVGGTVLFNIPIRLGEEVKYIEATSNIKNPLKQLPKGITIKYIVLHPTNIRVMSENSTLFTKLLADLTLREHLVTLTMEEIESIIDLTELKQWKNNIMLLC